MHGFRILVAIVFGLVAALMLYVTMTIPAISATAPAILTVACVAVAWVTWPKARKA